MALDRNVGAPFTSVDDVRCSLRRCVSVTCQLSCSAVGIHLQVTEAAVASSVNHYRQFNASFPQDDTFRTALLLFVCLYLLPHSSTEQLSS